MATANAFATRVALNTAVSAWVNDNANALSTYGPISSWNVASITDMSRLFYDGGAGFGFFNDDISSWDTSGVTDMNGMFYVRPASALSSMSIWSSLHAACTATVPCLPASHPACRRPPSDSAGRIAVQPAAELRHVQRHEHVRHVCGAPRECLVLHVQLVFPTHCLHRHRPTPSRPSPHMSPPMPPPL